MYITYLEALNMAIKALNMLEKPNQSQQAIERLETLKKSTKIHWSKELVFKQLDLWKEEHGRNPRVTNLREMDMPSGSVIQSLFDMRPSAFLQKYYPMEKRKPVTTAYSETPPEELLFGFVEQFKLIQPKSSKEFNLKRKKGTPTWDTVARYNGMTTWKELLKRCDLTTRPMSELPRVYKIDSTSSLFEKQKQYYKELEELLNKIH